jgi:hypothetical protein
LLQNEASWTWFYISVNCRSFSNTHIFPLISEGVSSVFIIIVNRTNFPGVFGFRFAIYIIYFVTIVLLVK